MLKIVSTGVAVRDQGEVGDDGIGAPDHGILERGGNDGEGIPGTEAVVPEHVGPVVPHVIDVRYSTESGQCGPEQSRFFVGVHDVVVSATANGLFQGPDSRRPVEDKFGERGSDGDLLDARHGGPQVAEAFHRQVLAHRVGHQVDFVPEGTQGLAPVEDTDRRPAGGVDRMW
jgi:hypothetical protein